MLPMNIIDRIHSQIQVLAYEHLRVHAYYFYHRKSYYTIRTLLNLPTQSQTYQPTQSHVYS